MTAVTLVRPAKTPTRENPVAYDERCARCHPTLPYAKWEEEMGVASQMAGNIQWWFGDLILFGEQRYPDRYAQAIELTGLERSTLEGWTWVARSFPPEARALGLPFSHYYEVARVARLDPDEAQRLLAQAEEHGQTVPEIREERKQWMAQRGYADKAGDAEALPATALDALCQVCGVQRGQAHEWLTALREAGWSLTRRKVRRDG